MISVDEATAQDFEQVYGLLMKLNATTISKETWHHVYNKPFAADGPPGFVLKDHDRIVGFFGTIFSRRFIDGKEIKLCNTHSWIVEEKYRRNGLLLLSKLHKIPEVVLTNFSASVGPYQIMKQFKWREIDNTHSIFFRYLLPFPTRTDAQVVKAEAMYEGLSESVKKIAEDHKPFRCTTNSLRTDKGNSLQVFKSVAYFPSMFSMVQKLLPLKFRLGQLYYTSNPEVFFTNFQKNMQAICKKEGWVGVVIPNRMLQKAGIVAGKKYFKNRPVLFKNTQGVDTSELDLLYSEVFILDLN